MIWVLALIIIFLLMIFAGREPSAEIPAFIINDTINGRINELSDQLQDIKRILADIEYEMKREKSEVF